MDSIFLLCSGTCNGDMEGCLPLTFPLSGGWVSLSLQIPACHLSSDITSDEEGRVYGSLRLREPTTRLLYVTPEKVRGEE